MPFEPFYHRDPDKPFAQYSPGETLYVVVNGDGLTEEELATAQQDYVQWISVPLAGVGLKFIWNPPPSAGTGTIVHVTFQKTGSHGASQTSLATYQITHNAQAFVTNKKYGAHVCLHEFLHVLGVPHELHNPLVHFCLKPNWGRILQWESIRDQKVDALRSENKTEEADWLSWHASQALKDFYYCLRWTLFSDDTEIAYQFDPFHATGGSVDLFHLYMDQIPGTEDIYTDKGIVVDTDRLMTSSLETFLKSRFTDQKVSTRLNGRKKWFLNAQGIYDPEIFLPDEYLSRMTYKNPFMRQLIDDNYACVEDMQWLKYETMYRYINLSGTDAKTREMCARQFPYIGCDPFRHDNFLNIWNKKDKQLSICPLWAANLRAYCIASQSPITSTPISTATESSSPISTAPVEKSMCPLWADHCTASPSPSSSQPPIASMSPSPAPITSIPSSSQPPQPPIIIPQTPITSIPSPSQLPVESIPPSQSLSPITSIPAPSTIPPSPSQPPITPIPPSPPITPIPQSPRITAAPSRSSISISQPSFTSASPIASSTTSVTAPIANKTSWVLIVGLILALLVSLAYAR